MTVDVDDSLTTLTVVSVGLITDVDPLELAEEMSTGGASGSVSPLDSSVGPGSGSGSGSGTGVVSCVVVGSAVSISSSELNIDSIGN